MISIESYVRLIKIIIFLIILAAEVFLSHQDGYKSGDESRRIAERLHLPDKVIRSGAHVLFFALLMFTGLVAGAPDHKAFVVIAVLLWTIADEASKPLLQNFRHFALPDVGFNLLGAGIGYALWLIIS